MKSVVGPTRVFSMEEVEKLQDTADASNDPWDGLFICLLFRTGLRIGSVSQLRWEQVLKTEGDGIRANTVVREKGNYPRAILIDEKLGARFWKAFQETNPNHTDCVFPRRVRTLRNRFYKLCKKAGFQGKHCHPHIAQTISYKILHRRAKMAHGRPSIVQSGKLDLTGGEVSRPPIYDDNQRLLLAIGIRGDRGAYEASTFPSSRYPCMKAENSSNIFFPLFVPTSKSVKEGNRKRLKGSNLNVPCV